MRKFAVILLLVFAFSGSALAQNTASKQFTLTVAPGTVTIATASLPAGVTGSSYSATVSASGGLAPYTFSVSTGTLPAGLSLSATTGAISGMPNGAGSSAFTISVADSETPTVSASQSYTITVTAPLGFVTTSLPAASIGSPYNAPIQLTGGVPPYTCTISTGILPTGLSLTTGGNQTISGTPVASGSFSFTITATDSAKSSISVKGTAVVPKRHEGKK